MMMKSKNLILITLSVWLFTSTAHGIHGSRKDLFNALYEAGVTEVAETTFGRWKSRSKVIDTAHPKGRYDITEFEQIRRPQFDYHQEQPPKHNLNIYQTRYQYEATQFGNFMICYQSRGFYFANDDVGEASNFQFCYIFPRPIHEVVEKLEVHLLERGRH